MIWIIVGAVVLFLIILWVVSKDRRYKKIFEPEHYVEFAESLAAVTSAACDKIGEPPTNPPTDDSRFFLTAARIVFLYTITEENGQYEHYFSISIAGRYTPHAVGRTFAIYVARLLGIDLDQLKIGISQANVFHSVFTLAQKKQIEFKNREISIPSLEDAEKIHAECFEQSHQLQCKRFTEDST